MPSKGEQKTVLLTVVKVDSAPRTFGDDGKAWGVTMEEDFIEGTEKPFKVEVYQEDALQPLNSLKGQGPKELVLEYSNDYKGTDSWKLVKAPGWERKKGSGGGKGMSPEAIGRMVAQSALESASRVIAVPNWAEMADAAKVAENVTSLADIFTEWILDTGKALAPKLGGGSAPAANGKGTRAQYKEMVEKIAVNWQQNDPEATPESVKGELVQAYCKEEGLHYPPADDELPKVIAHLAAFAG